MVESRYMLCRKQDQNHPNRAPGVTEKRQNEIVVGRKGSRLREVSFYETLALGLITVRPKEVGGTRNSATCLARTTGESSVAFELLRQVDGKG